MSGYVCETTKGWLRLRDEYRLDQVDLYVYVRYVDPVLLVMTKTASMVNPLGSITVNSIPYFI